VVRVVDSIALVLQFQAAEKALKAAYFTKDSDNTSNQDLVTLASRLNDSQVSTLASQIAGIIGDVSELQYPAQGQTPHDRHGRDTYRTVYSLTETLLRRVHDEFFA
jgi:HEPN domain-containing protein